MLEQFQFLITKVRDLQQSRNIICMIYSRWNSGVPTGYSTRLYKCVDRSPRRSGVI